MINRYDEKMMKWFCGRGGMRGKTLRVQEQSYILYNLSLSMKCR